ncbi:uncharacterized protein AMSG_01978 [Thecamonas trahens ATCC 50062]|uniref:Uncharacterized protein n=1 Tax=Thecamonas trahens ATCC 50062 TaxID=461836 RepID=A0A0L0DUF0_THETB|nr:hypothetical protein AMSG_01978 [Thecamonas trahens ATCC 50062]KNC55964.1 hypothetical protein AMSG_01978 [Thecamonas trahens ATCC 50062]|eukprot:XP_013761011.1 hypothetical protein AMSG_01978 [Thecamonas trahens ATCC 50062]
METGGASAAGGGVRELNTQVEVEGRKASNVVVNVYTDKVVVMVTQNNRLGTVIEAKKDLCLDGKEPTYSLNTLLGRRGEAGLIDGVYARGLMERFGKRDNRPVVAMLAILDDHPSIFRAVMACIDAHLGLAAPAGASAGASATAAE